jgi:hypothetical protein
MPLLKRWRTLLIILVCSGIGWTVKAYIGSPGYRAAQAYARIHEDMTPDEIHKILRQYGGERMPTTYSGVRFVEWDDRWYWFSDHCSITVIFSPEGKPQCVMEKQLRRQTFGGWLSSLLCSIKSSPQTYQSDPGERAREMLVSTETLEQIREEWQRFRELERQTPSTAK